MLDIRLFGQLRVLLDGVPIKLSTPPKCLPLWAYLLLHPEAISRDRLAMLLWPDDEEATTRANLRRHLHRLQHALPPAPPDRPWFLITSDTIAWNLNADFMLDVREFERLSSASSSVAEAVKLYTGDLLENLYDEVLLFSREQLRELYLRDLADLLRSAREARDNTSAMRYAQLLLAAEPLREDALRHLLAVRYSSGDRAGALADYAHFAQLLHTELDADPMPETVAIYEAIRRNDPLPDTNNSGAEPTSAGKKEGGQLMPFAGREREMQQLHEYWREVVRGHGKMVLLSGEAGIGKSRLAGEMALQAELDGTRVLRGTGSANEPVPYQTITQALREALPLVAALNIDRLWLSALLPLLPELAIRRPDLHPLPTLAPAQDSARLFEALTRTLIALSQPRPLLLVLEDLHWAGTSTLSYLEYLSRSLAGHQILVLATYREEEAPRDHPLRRLRRTLLQEQTGKHIALDRLPLATVQSLVRAMLGENQLDNTIESRLFTESEGNPFFLNELLRDWLEADNLGDPSRQGEARTLPGSVREVINSRLARLSQQTGAVVGLAAVSGPAFGFELLREAGGWSDSEVLEAVGELLDRQLIREAGHGEWDYAFAHHLIQEAIYISTPAAALLRRHRRLAQVLEELYPMQREEMAARLALHYDRGGAPDHAVPYYLSATRRALALYADEEALAHLARALELAHDAADRWELLELREEIYGRQGNRASQRTDLEELADIASNAQDPDYTCDVLLRRILFERALGDRAAEAAAIEALTKEAEASGSLHWQARAALEAASHNVLITQYDIAKAFAEEALALYETLGEPGEQVTAYCLLAEVAIHQGRFAVAEKLLESTMSTSTALKSPERIVNVLKTATVATILRQDLERGLALCRQMLELCTTIGDRDGVATAHARMAVHYVRMFKIAEAREHYKAAAAIYHTTGNRSGQAIVLVNTSALVGRLGHYQEALDGLEQAEVLFTALGDRRGIAVCGVNRGELSCYAGNYAFARASLEKTLEVSRSINYPVLVANSIGNLSVAERELGDLEAAIEHGEEGLALRRTLGDQTAELGQDLCDLTMCYLLGRDLTKARETAADMMALYKANPEGQTSPGYILLAAACVEKVEGNHALATELIGKAYEASEARADAIPDTESRSAFLELPFNRKLRAAYQQDVWPI